MQDNGLPVALSSSLTKLSNRHEWLVCGWFTDDSVYRPLAEQLAASLDQVGAPYDLVATHKRSGGWEANTMAKPAQVLAAMDRHPDKTIIFLDVDCLAVGDLAPLADVPSDICIRFRSKRRRNRIWMTPRSSTIVIRPTQAARRFIGAWRDASEKGRLFEVDQGTFVLTLCATSGVSFSALDKKWGAMDDDNIKDAVIVHNGVSQSTTKVRGLYYLVRSAFGL